MQFYTVHEPPDAPIDRVDRAGSLTFIGDRYTPTATAFGPFWLLANRLWHAFGAYVVALAIAAVVVFVAGLNWRWLTLMVGALNLIVGFEAASLKRWALEQRGWRTLGTVSGRTLDECERRFLEGWLPEQRMSRQDEFVATVNTLRGSAGGVAVAAASSAGAGGGRLDTAPARRGWLSWRRS